MSLRLLPFASAATLLVTGSAVFAADEVRSIPPPGIAVPEEVRAELTKDAATLAREITAFKEQSPAETKVGELPNAEIFHKAVDWALRYDEFFDPKQFDIARDQLAQGRARLALLANNEKPWNSATGLVARAYRSEIDGSVQPYGLVIPTDWKADDNKAWPLHFWCHGRGEKLTELAFIAERQRDPGEFTPPDAIVCHLYGRFCNANKFAGERDLFEALDDIKKHYRIDEQRLVIRGFSMGGAAAWQFATHHAGMWAAAAPGAGFAETAEFFNVFAPGKTPPPWWEQILWRWYDSTTMAANLANTKTIAYSGEIDAQKQAADIMVRYAKKEGVEFPHIIGPLTGHKYHPDSKPQVEEFVSAAVAKGRDVFPRKVHFTTHSLVHSRMNWLRLMAMERQWERADLDGEISDDGEMQVKTQNVSAFHIVIPDAAKPPVRRVMVDGQTVNESEGCTFVALVKQDGKWARLSDIPEAQRPLGGKQPFLCGPIDQAFMNRFVFVRPTGKPLNEAVGAWAKAELDHAIGFWRKVFRGDAPVKDDKAITQEDIVNSCLVLFGDPSSNAILKRMMLPPGNEGAPKRNARALPLVWTADRLEMRGVKYEAATQAPVLIHPNPLSPLQYVVLNSGPTFREEALLNNSDQTPKLPDWAIIDLRTPPGPKWPGEVIDAGFFDEQWR